MEQKLVSIYMDSWGNHQLDPNTVLKSCMVTEHLGDYLEEGWTVKALSPLNCATNHTYGVAGWIFVVLEKP